jgi:hypothetical protein
MTEVDDTQYWKKSLNGGAPFPPSTLLIGPGGSGKTTSLVTLLSSGLKLRLLGTEPSAAHRVLVEAKKRNISLEGFDWSYISPGVAKWDSLLDSAKLINTLALEDIAKLRQGIAKPDGQMWIKFLQGIASFTSARTGEVLGDATEWGPDCAFAIDGLTGVSSMSRTLTVGLKPTPSSGEWGVMQGNILEVLRKLCSDCRCFFVLIAHVEREMNEITGSANLTVSTLGAKLAPKLPPLFTNVIYAKRLTDKFYWSTADANVDTKAGDLPLNAMMEPSFRPIVESFRQRLTLENQTPAAPPAGPSSNPSAALGTLKNEL